jgi:hypothetical protein
VLVTRNPSGPTLDFSVGPFLGKHDIEVSRALLLYFQKKKWPVIPQPDMPTTS